MEERGEVSMRDFQIVSDLGGRSAIRQKGNISIAAGYGDGSPFVPGDGSQPPVAEHDDEVADRDASVEDILVVDDDPETVSVVGAALEEQGWRVRTAASGEEGLAMAFDRPPHVAIVDLIMPEMGGAQVCAALRADPRFARTRILVLSGAEDTRVVAAGCDADSAVIKPFTPELLVHEVRRLVGQ
jgi:CheY-like chemotaxis protein